MSQQLINVLEGCLSPNTVHASEQRLQQLCEQDNFTEQLLRLLPNLQSQMLIIALSTLKNYITARYNAEHNRIRNDQKELLRNSILDLYYEIKENPNAVKLYKEIVYLVVAVDFPWHGIEEQLMQDLGNRIEAGVYFTRQVVKVYDYIEGPERQPLEKFVINVFPKLEELVEQILSNFNQATSGLLEIILKSFYSAFHITVPEYLRDFGRLDKWLVFFSCTLSTPTSELSVKSQGMVARIYIKLFSMYCNDSQDLKIVKGWANEFRNRHACKLYEQVYQLVASRTGDEQILSNLINCLHEVVKKEELRQLLTNEHIQNLFYNGILLPLCESNKEELDMFQHDEIEYVRRQEDLTCFLVRRAILDLIEISVHHLAFDGKAELMRMVEFCATVMANQGASDGEKEVAIRILSTIGTKLLKQSYFKKEFEPLVVTYFQPLLGHPNKLLNSLICNLLSQYLPFGDLSPQTVQSLMEMIYSKILGDNSLVVQYSAILAFTSLLGHKAALESAKPHFQDILTIYVKTLNTFDHENLLECLESIVKHFDTEIVSFAPDLISHLLKMFCSLAKNDPEGDEDDDEPDGNTPASAALSTVKQILNCKLAPEVYLNISGDLIDLLRGIFGQYSGFFDEVLSLFAVLCHRSNLIADFQYPYAVCRQLLEGKNFNLSGSKLSGDLVNEISKIEKADSEFQDNLMAILKNIIQKAPDQVLRNYPWPVNQELILALIENRRISAEELSGLNTSSVNELWSTYLSAYSWVVFNIGGLSDPQAVRGIVGVSLFPWLKEGINPALIKIIADSVDDEYADNDDEDYLNENTEQLLEKYANEDEQDDAEDFEEGEGDNYGYLYESPFDCSKDREMLITQLRAMPQEAAIEFANSLSNKYRKTMELLMNPPAQ